jgi:hypothetical protein
MLLQNRSFAQLSSSELDLVLASLWHNQRYIDWSGKDMRTMIIYSQFRVSEILVDHVYKGTHLDDYAIRRVRWSCSIARLKCTVIRQAQWSRHCSLSTTGGALPREISLSQFTAWLVFTTTAWDGPRLREAIQKADRRRRARPDEIGMMAAFMGTVSMPRARAAEDSREAALQSLDCIELIKSETIGSDAELLRELLIMKLMHNALEAANFPGFADTYIVLSCMRDFNKAQTYGENTSITRIVEIGNGFVVTPHRDYYPVHPVSFVEACILWYRSTFDTQDPLQIHM